MSCDEFVTEYKRMMHFRSFAYLRKNFNALDQMDGDKDGQISKETFFQVLVAKLGTCDMCETV